MKINTASFLISLSIILGQDSLQIFFHIVSYLLIFWFQADVVYVLEFLCYVGSFRIIIPDWILLQTFASTVPFHWGHISSRLTTESMYGGLLQFWNIVWVPSTWVALIFSVKDSEFDSLTVWKWMNKLFKPSEHILLEANHLQDMGVAHFWQQVTNHFLT